jgi:hypothetical protein
VLEECNLSKIDEGFEKEEKSIYESDLSVKSATSYNSWSVSPDRRPPIGASKVKTHKSWTKIFENKTIEPSRVEKTDISTINIIDFKNEATDVTYEDKIVRKSFRKIDWSIPAKLENKEEKAENYLRALGTQLARLKSSPNPDENSIIDRTNSNSDTQSPGKKKKKSKRKKIRRDIASDSYKHPTILELTVHLSEIENKMDNQPK